MEYSGTINVLLVTQPEKNVADRDSLLQKLKDKTM